MPRFHLANPLVLASTSAIRERMLHQAGLAFTMIRPKCDEDALRQQMKAASPREMALALARAKAASVNAMHPGWLVIGADQICALPILSARLRGEEGPVRRSFSEGGREACEVEYDILSKPGSADNAIAQLKNMRGKTHSQVSAVCLYHEGKVIWETVEEATLTMRDLSDGEIAAYVALDTPLSACGSYTYESHGKHLFSNVAGKDDVIMGLPLQAVLSELYRRKLLAMDFQGFPN